MASNTSITKQQSMEEDHSSQNGEKQRNEEEILEEEPMKKKRFLLPNLNLVKSDWDLPNELADFYKERCQSYLSEKELEEFMETPCPQNIPN